MRGKYRVVRGCDSDGDLYYEVQTKLLLLPLWSYEHRYWDKCYYGEGNAYEKALNKCNELYEKEEKVRTHGKRKVVYKID